MLVIKHNYNRSKAQIFEACKEAIETSYSLKDAFFGIPATWEELIEAMRDNYNSHMSAHYWDDGLEKKMPAFSVREFVYCTFGGVQLKVSKDHTSFVCFNSYNHTAARQLKDSFGWEERACIQGRHANVDLRFESPAIFIYGDRLYISIGVLGVIPIDTALNMLMHSEYNEHTKYSFHEKLIRALGYSISPANWWQERLVNYDLKIAFQNWQLTSMPYFITIDKIKEIAAHPEKENLVRLLTADKESKMLGCSFIGVEWVEAE